jgi:hypothetical protein
MSLLFLANVGSTLAMAGVILIIQFVHYPLFNQVGRAQFAAYEAAHSAQITLVVMPLMFIELGTSVLLAFDPPKGVPAWLMWAGLVTVGINWFSTAFLQVPLHGQLSAGFDQAAYEALVNTNWIRTIAWCAHAALVLWATYLLIERP